MEHHATTTCEHHEAGRPIFMKLRDRQRGAGKPSKKMPKQLGLLL
jgi:hypothetical protein